MIQMLRNLAVEVKRKLPIRSALLLPGECFFCRTLELPTEIGEEEMAQFAEFSIENLSPFPIEQLAWGFFHETGAKKILIYAVYLERLRQKGFSDLDQYYHVYPGFVAALNQTFSKPTAVFTACHDSLTLALFGADSPIPEAVHSISYDSADSELDALRETHARLASRVDASKYIIERRIHLTADIAVEADDSMLLRGSIADLEGSSTESFAEPLELDGRATWSADVRPTAFVSTAGRQEKISQGIWQSTLLAGAAAAILLLLQIGFLVAGFTIQAKKKTVDERAQAVSAIEERDTLLQRIEHFSQGEFRLFQMLEIMNLERPRAVHFTKAFGRSSSELQVEGLGSNVEVVNRFAENLRQSPQIKTVQTNVSSRQGRAPFTLTVTFSDREFNPEAIAARAVPQEN